MPRSVVAYSLLALVFALLAVTATRLPSRDQDAGNMVQTNETSSRGPARPARTAISNWLQASNDEFATRAEDYAKGAPRRRNQIGEPEPFRIHKVTMEQMQALRDASVGVVVRVDLFPDVGFDLRITGRRQDAAESKLFAAVEGFGESDRFSMSWMDQQTRGLFELPSRNRAYEILLLADGSFVAREWLYTDVICARSSADGKSADAGIPLPAATTDPSSSFSAAAPVPVFNSRASAVATIYLDFDGEVVSGTSWLGGATINALPARMTTAQIEETWRRVASHFAPFDVNVTTDRSVYDKAPANRKTHCIITPTKDARPSAGGVAYLYSFTNPSSLTKVCWTFVDQVPADSAMVCSHEIGHTLGLDHHGKIGAPPPEDEYYFGHGTGQTGWGPFMGAPYGKNLLQWSKGEYAGANNSAQDDLAMMTTPARIPYIADDHSNATATATPLTSGVPVQGRVEANTDSDFFRMVAGTGQQPLRVDLPEGTMLDVKLEVFDDTGQLISTVNPADALAITTVMNFPTPRTIYFRVLGTGKAPVTGSGYSSYSSLGGFTLTAGSPVPGQVTNLAGMAETESAIRLTWPAVAGATSYRIFRQGVPIANVNALAYLDRGVSETNSYSYIVEASNAAGQGAPSTAVTVTTPTWLAANPLGIRVTVPSAATNASGSLLFSGQIGGSLTNGLFWSNAASGQTGQVVVAGNAWSHAVPLAAGTNVIAFYSGYQRTLGTNVAAYDSPANPVYTRESAWTDGMQAGLGFLPWNIPASSGTGSHAVANSYDPSGPTLVGSFYGWGVRSAAGAASEAVRRSEQPLGVSSVLRTSVDFNIKDGTNVAGFFLGDGSVERLRLEAVGSITNYVLTDAGGPRDTGIARSANGLSLEFTMQSGGRYLLALGTNRLSGTLASGGALDTVRVSTSAASADETFYLGSLEVSSPVLAHEQAIAAAPPVIASAGLTDGIPDAWWIEYFGATAGVSAAADGDGDGFSNQQEFHLGTSPVDSNSAFRIGVAQRVEAGLSVSWSAVPGKRYQIFVSPSLAPPDWQPQGAIVVAQDSETVITRTATVPESSEYFLRIGLVP